ncbi:MAG: site-specific integrase [Rhodocyclaceae bacterium]|nr:site-specific integrase [Rhodocyclaceae bacterium]
MQDLKSVMDAFTASREFDVGSLSRFGWWADRLGDRPLAGITQDEVDACLVQLAQRGKLRPMRNGPAVPTGQPLSGATINRFVTTLGQIYTFARRTRLVPRNFVPPTRGIEKAPERVDPERYLRPEEVERLIKVARAFDIRWGRMVALIVFQFHTGVRIGDTLALRWRDIDLAAATATICQTKNGSPHVAALTDRCIAELVKLPGRQPDAWVFANNTGTKPFDMRRLWCKVTQIAGLPGRGIHQLRHGCGSALATAGINQAQIMAVMGHKTLVASARYIHSNVSDRRAVVARVFAEAV